MFLSQLLLNPMNREVLRDLRNIYDLHRTLLRGYPFTRGNEQGADLLFRLETDRQDRFAVLVQTAKNPDWNLLPTNYFRALPVTKSLEGIQFLSGQRLQFRLRANPTKRVLKHDPPLSSAAGTASQRDTWVGKRIGLFREQDQETWFKRKADSNGFSVIGLRVIPEGTIRCWKSKDTGNVEKPSQRLSFVSALFEGVIQITDPEKFSQAWSNGIGTGKGFGFGLLSIAPA